MPMYENRASPEVVGKFGDGQVDYSVVDIKLRELQRTASDFIDDSLKHAMEGKL